MSDAAVVDASVLAALLFGEPRADEAAAAMTGRRLVAPTLLRYELASVCRRKVEASPHLRAGLLEALSLADRLDLRLVDLEAEPLVEVALAASITAYDAAYLRLAELLAVDLLTFDVRLAAARAARQRSR